MDSLYLFIFKYYYYYFQSTTTQVNLRTFAEDEKVLATFEVVPVP